MKNFFCGVILIVIAECVTKFRLSTNELTKLTPEDTLVSTLGLFRMKLRKSGCQLAVDIFDNSTSKYSSKGNFSSQLYTQDCDYLTIGEGKILTDIGSDYLVVEGVSFNYSTILTIDDEGRC